ncbi:MAG: DegT/DnrJ/EryC1/StrS family aminotransferase [Thermoguttaceae bacterium]|nr:DegT/DnrJ/EryC1/StrS family aminotransferase [Thermoguttaceae bacterium]
MRNYLFPRRRFLAQAAVATGTVGTSGFWPCRWSQAEGKADVLAALGGTPVRQKAFTPWPPVTPQIEASLLTTLRSRQWGRSLQGPMKGTGAVVQLENRFAQLVGAKYCLATGSCTQALHTALHAVGVEAGDEVLVSPCTFIASVQAILVNGALPVFVDVDINTFQMDPSKIEALITPETRAIEPVHIAGLPCDMEPILKIARQHKLAVVEDAAQAHLARYKDRYCGTFGHIGCFSFQTSKQIACGEGGALVTDDPSLAEACYVFHNMGLGPNGNSVGIGTKYRMNEFEAAVLLPQLETLPEEIARRDRNALYLASLLEQIPGIIPQKRYPAVTQGAYYLFGLRYVPEAWDGVPRDVFLRALRAEGVPYTTMYFDRLNRQPFIEAALESRTFRRIFSLERLRRYREANHCPNNDLLASQGIWLPQNVLLGDKQDMEDIAEAFGKIYRLRSQLSKLSKAT